MSDTAQNREILELEKLRVEINKIIAETARINAENKYYPLLMGAGAATGLLGLGMLILRLFS